MLDLTTSGFQGSLSQIQPKAEQKQSSSLTSATRAIFTTGFFRCRSATSAPFAHRCKHRISRRLDRRSWLASDGACGVDLAERWPTLIHCWNTTM